MGCYCSAQLFLQGIASSDKLFFIDIMIIMEIVMITKHLFAATITLLLLSNIAHAAGDPKVKSAMAKSDCFTCHSVNAQVVGPAYKEVAKRYHGTMAPASTIATLAEKVIKGGNGNWNKETGGSPMTAHANLSKVQATDMVKWVLAQ